MKYNKNFDLDAVLQTLGKVNDQHEEWSPEDEALRIASVALVFVQHKDMLDELREFFDGFYSADPKRQPSQMFATQEQADDWLKQGTAKDGELVNIAGQGFQIVIRPTRSFFLRTPLLEELQRAKEDPR